MKYIIALVLILITQACYYDVEEVLYGDPGCILEDVSYSNTIEPIIARNCYRCHDAENAFFNIVVDDYANLKNYVDDGSLLGTIQHDAAFSPMPKDSEQLLECEIEKIKVWIENGAPNN